MSEFLDLNGLQTFLHGVRNEYKNYVDDKTDDGYHINGDNLTFREGNEIIISGLNATKNDSGTVDGVTISGGKVILSPDIFGQQDIKLEKASGIYSGYEMELEAGTELTAPVYTPSVLSASNGVVIYQTHSQTEGYIFNNDNSVTYGENITQKNCTISGLQSTLAVDNGTIEGINFDYDKITISATAIDSLTQTTIDGANFEVNTDSSNVLLKSSNTKTTSKGIVSIASGVSNSSVMANNAATIYGNGGGNVYQTYNTAVLGFTPNDTIYKSIKTPVILVTNFIDEETNKTVTVYDDTVANAISSQVSVTGGGRIKGIKKSSATDETVGDYEDLTLGDVVKFIDGKGKIFESTVGTETDRLYFGTSDAESITVTGTNCYLEAGSGADSIIVQCSDSEIVGGKAHDYITIDSGAHGNIYHFDYGDGKDSIYGWGDGDTLLFTHKFESVMSQDGNQISIKSGAHSVTFTGLDRNKTIKVQTVEGGAVQEVTFIKLMKGTAASQELYNIATAAGGYGHDDGTATDVWTIDAAGGNDDIKNNYSFVSISGGSGNDSITIANTGTTVSSVTINAGIGNDVIDVRGDTVASADFKTGKNVGAHTYVFGPADSIDSIWGYNSNDTIILEGFDSGVLATVSHRTNTDGDFIITAGATQIVIVHPDDDTQRLGGTKLNILTKDGSTITDLSTTEAGRAILDLLGTDVGDGTTHSYEIPKEITYPNSSDYITATTSAYDNYSIKAQNGADEIVISAKAVSLDAGAGNDFITLQGGTNVNTTATSAADKYNTVGGIAMLANSAHDTTAVVTINGGIGNDYIDATGDTIAVSDTDHTTVRAGHVYEIDDTSGRDSIMGFNEYDTIKVTDYPDGGRTFSADFDSTGKFYVLKIGNAQLYLDVTKTYFKGGSSINIVKNDGTPITTFLKPVYDETTREITGYSTIRTGLAASGAFDTVGLTAGGDETTESAESYKYVIPRKLVGTNYADDIWSGNKLINTDSNFRVNALSGDDQIDNVGASNVYIDAGRDADVVRLLAEETASATIYGENVTVNGGMGNDSIYAEYVTVASNNSDTAYATQINIEGTDYYAIADKKVKFGHTYEVDYQTGSDTIYFFGDKDVIKFNENSSYVGCSVASGTNDLVIGIGAGSNATRAVAWVTLKDFRKDKIADPNRFITPLNILGWNGTEYSTVDAGVVSISADDDSTIRNFDNFYNNVVFLATGDNDTLTNLGDNTYIRMQNGNDEVLNTGDSVTIDAGVGNDTISNFGNNFFIYGGLGNDTISLGSSAFHNTVHGGVGDDSINNSGTNTTYTYSGNIVEGTDTITGFNQATDLIQITDTAATISFALNVSNNLTATVGKRGITYATIILDGVSSGSVRYKIGDGDIQTYTIA